MRQKHGTLSNLGPVGSVAMFFIYYSVIILLSMRKLPLRRVWEQERWKVPENNAVQTGRQENWGDRSRRGMENTIDVTTLRLVTRYL